MDSKELRSRTKQFALRVLQLVDALPNRRSSDAIARQLVRSATSVGANYRAACRGRSRAEFISKMCIVLEEADESLYWIELIAEHGIIPQERLASIRAEANELTAIFTSTVRSAKQNKPADKQI